MAASLETGVQLGLLKGPRDPGVEAYWLSMGFTQAELDSPGDPAVQEQLDAIKRLQEPDSLRLQPDTALPTDSKASPDTPKAGPTCNHCGRPWTKTWARPAIEASEFSPNVRPEQLTYWCDKHAPGGAL